MAGIARLAESSIGKESDRRLKLSNANALTMVIVFQSNLGVHLTLNLCP